MTAPKPLTALLRFDRAKFDEVAANHPTASLVDQVFQMLAGPIQASMLSVGTKLPSVRSLAHDCKVSADTAARAYDRLVAHGLAEARRGSGYFVRAGGRRAAAAPPPRPAFAGPLASGPSRWRSMLVKQNASLSSRTGSGSFPSSWYDTELVATALRGVVRQGIGSLADYSDFKGYPPLRQQLQLKLQEIGITAEAEQVLVTGGATEAIHLVCQALMPSAGTPVLLESPAPPLLVDRLMSTGLSPHRVVRLPDGPDIDAVRALCEQYRPRAFFCSTVLHNPTGSHIAPHKAFQILRLAEEFDMILIEDDSYGDLMPLATVSPILRLATLDQLRRVIYVGSFSKTLGPGLRMGFLATNPERIDWLTTFRVVQGISGSALSERVLYRVLSGGEYRRHCEQLRNRLAEARPVVLEELRRWGIDVENVPDAGLFLWASLGDGVDSLQVAERMLETGHLLAPAQAFLAGGAPPNPLVRINVAQAYESAMLPALGKVLGRSLPPRKGAPP
ncbi:PLP-dependent aminotransferase family protein [Piscinibacter sakaiensis]|uniref:Transcriptional regulator, GntR family domain/aspartate aminotransferase n=1 Tax=Piscinibacter sakaiensis TaxID=1547922 RepID=A0A0K8P1C9_PISS1|nr:PLP-dependent aminotransferase family protein [Piscinibacter sakaiensis]GAP36344.1 transcriptional regulator, GntR family domain/aspartate aminotransferase [Piscinibacter sakaiensis]